MKRLFFPFSLIGVMLVLSGFSSQKLSEKVVLKESLLKAKLQEQGYAPTLRRISGHRSKVLNKILPLSSKTSYHLKGLAIDVLVGDVNKDKMKDGKDVDLVVKTLEAIHKSNPDLIGGIGTYKKHWYSRQMVHFDVRGYEARWKK